MGLGWVGIGQRGRGAGGAGREIAGDSTIALIILLQTEAGGTAGEEDIATICDP